MAREQTSGFWGRQPLFVLLLLFFALSMYVPAIHALVQDDHATSRSFFYAGTLGLIAVTLVAIVLSSRKTRYGAFGQLLSLLAAFIFVPLFLAVPLHDALGTTRFLNAYVDMVSALTTTGADIFGDPGRLNDTLHLWRAQVAWMGGLMMWIAASAILAPLSLGGFEVTAQGQPGRGERGDMAAQIGDPRLRILRAARVLVPIYSALTVVLWIALLMAGDRPLVALCHAMSVMATSGISPLGGVEEAQGGVPGEMVMALFMFFALSRLTFSSDTVTKGNARLDRDPEFRIGLVLVIGVPLVLFLRHWLGAYDVDQAEQGKQALRALWGSIFTVLSFLSTTGFASADWAQAQTWSGLGTPGLILMGLALIGGGVATTAGGVKLLRVYVLYLNGLREMDRLVHPSSVGREGSENRRIHRNGAFIAWIFFMLFALSLAAVTVILTLFDVGFEDALVLSVAALSTTGPLIEVAGEGTIRLVELSAGAKLVLAGAMVLGRFETLAIIALVSADTWRR
ncbi:potassium transporter TrkG [Aestuariivita sp.]|jgi:trk system potassium uptake protein TrkH|uniref:TrkH family potassium uptake protein n=1 Tax=Aestuariivita sp. TaxID=1872407 RepID=UPI00216D8914|nr:potassium transporter TrkG [Aestuariivita sp.]MCE8009854.1 TrkH family potassium uptake protein [Aestuariivita sp.]